MHPHMPNEERTSTSGQAPLNLCSECASVSPAIWTLDLWRLVPGPCAQLLDKVCWRSLYPPPYNVVFQTCCSQLEEDQWKPLLRDKFGWGSPVQDVHAVAEGADWLPGLP